MNMQRDPQISLAGKTAIVTGGGSGIGRAIVLAFMKAGARVVSMDLTDRAEVAEGCVAVSGDVTCLDDCEKAIDTGVARYGSCDILVNAAGIVEKTRRTVRQSVEDWKRTMDVNLLGTYQMSKTAARRMIDSGSSGSIINISSVAGLGGFKASNAYGVSKAGVAMMTRTMALDLADSRIRVNAVAPGFISTPMTADLDSASSMSRDAFIQRIPLGRFGETNEVAPLILFLCSDWATYITGAVIPVDGGWSAFSGPSAG